MVDIIKEAHKILEELGYEPDNIEVKYKKERLRFANAGYMKKCIGPITGDQHPHRIYLSGNEPSFIRIGLAYLLIHELGHHEYRKDNKHDADEDYFSEFKERERKVLERFWEICLESDDELNKYTE